MKKAEIYIYPSFYKDLNKMSTNDIGQAFKKIYTNSGDWKLDKEDKSYKMKSPFGIAMERKISRGDRVIYIKDGHKIYLLNVGHHDKHTKGGGLTAPKNIKENSTLSNSNSLENGENPFKDYFTSENFTEKSSKLFFSRKSPKLSEKLTATLKQPMHEITFISPFLSEELFEHSGFIKNLISRHITDEKRAKLRIITSAPVTYKRLMLLDELEYDGWSVDWCENLHAKIYIFKPNTSLMDVGAVDKSLTENCYLIGSANLTKAGLGLHDRGNHEICENLDESLHQETEKFIKFLSNSFYNETSKQRMRRKLFEGHYNA